MNVFVYRQMATGYAKFLIDAFNKHPTKHASHPVAVITHDNRLHGDTFALACAEVLAAYDIQVYLAPFNQLLATPIIFVLDSELTRRWGH